MSTDRDDEPAARVAERGGATPAKSRRGVHHGDEAAPNQGTDDR